MLPLGCNAAILAYIVSKFFLAPFVVEGVREGGREGHYSGGGMCCL